MFKGRCPQFIKEKAMKNFKSSVLTLFLVSAPVWALLPESFNEFPQLGGRPLALNLNFAGGSESYQIGDEWGKYAVDWERIGERSVAYRAAAMRTARVGGGTGFVLGQFDGEMIVATNHHVVENQNMCARTRVRFEALNVSTQCERVVGSWTDVDLTLFTVKVSKDDASKLLSVAANFAFSKMPQIGQALMSFGYGSADNPWRKMVVVEDKDCRVTSSTGDLRFMADPDEFNPGPYKAWSFSNACDVSHGDSGSAMVDRETGEIMGIIWTGKIPKNSRVRSSDYIQKIQEAQSQDVWTELSYAAPAFKMKEVLTEYLRIQNIDAKDRSVLEALLQ